MPDPQPDRIAELEAQLADCRRRNRRHRAHCARLAAAINQALLAPDGYIRRWLQAALNPTEDTHQ